MLLQQFAATCPNTSCKILAAGDRYEKSRVKPDQLVSLTSYMDRQATGPFAHWNRQSCERVTLTFATVLQALQALAPAQIGGNLWGGWSPPGGA